MNLLSTILQNPGTAVLYAALGFVSYHLILTFQSLYFSSLSHIPGPALWAATRARWMLSVWSGTLHSDVWALHKRHGPIVRIAPDEVSFAHPDAWKQIYANNGPNAPAFPKSELWHGAAPGRPTSILNARDIGVHSRMRRAMDPAFGERAVKMQEPVVQKHVGAMVEGLERLAVKEEGKGAVVDIVRWLAFVAFDIVGDLGFGEPFGCLENENFHPWVEMIFNSLRAATYMATLRFYPSLNGLLSMMIPKSVFEKQKKHWALASDKVDRRLNSEMQRPDLISMIKQDADGVEGLTVGEMHATAALLIVAGSETTTSVLAGTVNYLVKNPQVLQKLATHLREVFKSEEETGLDALRNAEYLNAVVQEGLRLCNPTPMGVIRQTPPEGATVCGVSLPGNTYVCVHPLTLSRSVDMFHEPDAFRPERWLKDAPPQFLDDNKNAEQTFGIGPRSCIGRPLAWVELRLILARLVWRFDLEAVDSVAGRLHWDDQKVFSVVQRQPFEVRLKVRRDLVDV